MNKGISIIMMLAFVFLVGTQDTYSQNIEELMKKKDAEQEPDDITQTITPKAEPLSAKMRDSLENISMVENAAVTKPAASPINSNPTPKKTAEVKSNPVKKPVAPPKKSPITQKPKAVMQSRV